MPCAFWSDDTIPAVLEFRWRTALENHKAGIPESATSNLALNISLRAYDVAALLASLAKVFRRVLPAIVF